MNTNKTSSKASLTSLVSEDLLKFEDDLSSSMDAGMTRSHSGSALSGGAVVLEDGSARDTQSLHEIDGTSRLSPDKQRHVPALTQAQQRAITG